MDRRQDVAVYLERRSSSSVAGGQHAGIGQVGQRGGRNDRPVRSGPDREDTSSHRNRQNQAWTDREGLHSLSLPAPPKGH